MTVLTIRAHKRYAARQPVTLRRPEGGAACTGLLIELSSEGFRISNLGRQGLAVGEPVIVELHDLVFHGKIRWSHDGIAGVRLDRALFANQLSDLLARGRGEAPMEVRRYGT